MKKILLFIVVVLLFGSCQIVSINTDRTVNEAVSSAIENADSALVLHRIEIDNVYYYCIPETHEVVESVRSYDRWKEVRMRGWGMFVVFAFYLISMTIAIHFPGY